MTHWIVKSSRLSNANEIENDRRSGTIPWSSFSLFIQEDSVLLQRLNHPYHSAVHCRRVVWFIMGMEANAWDCWHSGRTLPVERPNSDG